MKILLFQENKRKSPSTRKLSAALTASYEITCDICVNSIHKYIYIYTYSDQENVNIVSCVNVLHCL
jgi:hypothetical protein